MEKRKNDADVRSNEVQAGLFGALLGGATYVLSEVPIPEFGLHPGAAAITGVAGAGFLGGAIAHHARYFGRTQVYRRSLGQDGFIDLRHWRSDCSPTAMFNAARYSRPALKVNRKTPVTAVGLPIGQLVAGERRVRGRWVHGQIGHAGLIIGPGGSGKSQLLIHFILDLPGPVVASTTKVELLDKTRDLRAEHGRVEVFNPLGIGGSEFASTVGIDLVAACRDESVANQTAAGMIRGSTSGPKSQTNSDEFWETKAREILRCFLMAAAIQGWDMRAVQHWAHDDEDTTPQAILDKNPEVVPAGWAENLRAHMSVNKRTRDGYFATLVSAVSFMDIPSVAEICERRDGRPQFDILDFLRGRNTLHLISSESDARLTPLMTAFVERIFQTAKTYAATSPGGILPLPLGLLLDELANATPVPFDNWVTDSRGWGIMPIGVIHDPAQLTSRYGDARRRTIMTAPIKINLGKIFDTEYLEAASSLSGEREVEVRTEGESVHEQTAARSTSTNVHIRKERVVTPQQIYALPKGYAHVLGLSHASCIVHYEPGNDRVKRELKKLCRRQKRAARKAPDGGDGDGGGMYTFPTSPTPDSPADLTDPSQR